MSVNSFADTLSGLHWFWPEIRGALREAWRLFKQWRRVEAPSRAPPLTVLLVKAIISRAVQKRDLSFAVLVALAYHALLRTGEALALRFCDLEFGSRCGVVSLPQSKSGLRTGSSGLARSQYFAITIHPLALPAAFSWPTALAAFCPGVSHQTPVVLPLFPSGPFWVQRVFTT